jgi:cation transport ATPase
MPDAAEASIISADVILLLPSLLSMVKAFEIAKATDKTIKQNIAISLVYNAITIPLAISGVVIPLVAAISMSISSLLVVGNSLRLNRLANGR